MIKIFKLIIVCFILSACMIKWEMKLTINDDLSGFYSLTAGIDEELQIFSLETMQSSLGGLDNVLDSVPEGYGKSFYSDEIYDGIILRNSFNNIDEFNNQLSHLKSNPDTALMLMSIQKISIEKELGSAEVLYRVFGEFAEIVGSEVTDSGTETLQMDYLYDLKLEVTLPGKMRSPIEISEGPNTVIFEPSGREAQIFEALSVEVVESNTRWDLLLILVILSGGTIALSIFRKNK